MSPTDTSTPGQAPPSRRMWGLALAAAMLVHLLTLDISPIFWQDEVQQVDFGRLTLEPASESSTKWSLRTGRPVRVWSYGGPLVHELFYRAAGKTPRAVRLAALLGAMLAATAMLGWLLARGTSPWPAGVVSMAFFLDPLFVKSYKGGRVDGWAFAAALGACWMLRRAGAAPERARTRAALAGALAAAAAMTWQSAVFLYPLILLELIHLLRRSPGTERGRRRTLALSASFFAGGLAVAAALALPLLPQWSTLVEDTRVFLSSSAATGAPAVARLRKLLRFGSMAGALNLSTVVLVTAFLAALIRREAGLLLATLAGYALIASTLIYSARVLYLIPYLFALTAGLFLAPPHRTVPEMPRWASAVLLIVLLVWTAGLSLVARPTVALKEHRQRDPQGLFQLAAEKIGEGPHEVYLGRTFEFYYAGRPLGWKIYAPNWEPAPQGSTAQQHLLALLRRVDFAVYRKRDLPEDANEGFLELGLQYVGTFCPNAPGFACKANAPPSAYGPYVLFARNP
ncbi:hypothetical protein [Rhodocaloribacter sp.]